MTKKFKNEMMKRGFCRGDYFLFRDYSQYKEGLSNNGGCYIFFAKAVKAEGDRWELWKDSSYEESEWTLTNFLTSEELLRLIVREKRDKDIKISFVPFE